MDLTLGPLSGPFGTEVLGVDLAQEVAAPIREALSKAVARHQVLLFRHQNLDDKRVREVASWFGEVRDLPGGNRRHEKVHGVRHLSNLGPDNKPNGRHPDRFSAVWHTDGASLRPPAVATFLYGITVPQQGGATQFADMYGGLESFDETERRRLETLDVIHDVELARVMRQGRALIINPDLNGWERLRARWRFFRRMLPGRATVHPVVCRHQHTGRAAIMLGSDAWRVRGMGWRRGMRAVEEWTARAIRDERVLTHHWQAGDVLIWDNRSLLHRVADYDTAREIRVMRQVVLLERNHDGSGAAMAARL